MPISAPPPSWASIKNKPNTVAGFGITDMSSQTVANATNASNVPWLGVSSKPTTISGYGITDEKCKAWVNFNGTGTVAIRASHNVSSITDNGVGDYTVNFVNAIQDANYVCNVTASRDNTGTGFIGSIFGNGTGRTANGARVSSFWSGTSTQLDAFDIHVSIFR